MGRESAAARSDWHLAENPRKGVAMLVDGWLWIRTMSCWEMVGLSRRNACRLTSDRVLDKDRIRGEELKGEELGIIKLLNI